MRHTLSICHVFRRWVIAVIIGPLFPIVFFAPQTQAVFQYQKVFITEYINEHPDKEYAKYVRRKARCHICHQGKGGKHNNVYGAELAKSLDHELDKKNNEKITAALREVGELPFTPADNSGPSFASRIAASKLPGGELQDLKKEPHGAEVQLFDGRSLAGWTGCTAAYEVREGAIVSLVGKVGNLFTKEEYADFILEFEFRLTSGANNGIGIRVPLEGHPSYEGIELQILDNSARKHAELQPYQFHGSAYGIAAAKRGHLKPVGMWNTQEVHCVGRQITVVLNSETILDIDLDESAPAGQTLDDKEHPGLDRASGHIGLLAHGTVVEYRNIKLRVVEIDPENK